MSACTLASVLLVKATGYTPIQKIRASTGARITHSRAERSASRRFSSRVTAPKTTRWYIHRR